MKKLVLTLLAMVWLLPALAAPALRVDSAIEMQLDDPRFGGFSSLEVTKDGMSFMATSDRGYLLQGEILRENGRMTGVANLQLSNLLDTKGAPLTGLNMDAEGLAVSEAGEVYMSFEANHRVMVQDDAESLPAFVPKHPDFRTLINNSGLEALAIGEDDTLYAIPERSGALMSPFPVYRLKEGVWNKDWSIPRIGEFLITGADVFASQLYVLERGFTGMRGFSSRIRRFDIGAESGDTLLETAAGDFDNMEGIAVWQPEGGAVRVLLIADDNYFFLQSNQLVELVLDE